MCLSCTFKNICVCLSFPFGFEGGKLDLVVFIPDHYLSINFRPS